MSRTPLLLIIVIFCYLLSPPLGLGVQNSRVEATVFPDITAALTSPSTAGKTIVISSPVNINSTTIPADRSLEVMNGGSINIANGNQLQIMGTFQAGMYKVFSGDGKITFGPGTVSEVRPEWWGARGNGDDVDKTTSAIQNAVNSGGGPVIFSKGIYKINKSINVNTPVQLKGAGQFSTFVVQTNPREGVFVFEFKTPTAGGGVEDISIHAGKPFNTSTGSSEAAISLKRSNGGFSSRNLDIQAFATGIIISSSFYPRFENFQILYSQNVGVHFSAPQNVPGSAGVFISKAKISNYGFTGNNNSSIGMLIEQSGGDFIDTVDVTSFQHALYIKPPQKTYVNYLFFNQFLADTSENDNIVIDGSLSQITAIEFTASWAAFSKNGSGIKLLGNVDGVQWNGGRIRENGQHGVVLAGGRNISFNNTHIARNSKSSTLQYDGIRIQAGTQNISIHGSRIGNFASGMTHEQADSVHVEKEFTGDLLMSSSDLRNQGTNKQSVNNRSNKQLKLLNNLHN